MSERYAIMKRTRPIAREVLELYFAVEDPPLAFRAGQYLSLKCGVSPEGTPVKRSYSIASPSSKNDEFVVIAKLAGGPGSTFLANLREGDRVPFVGPMGFFVLDLAHQSDVVFAATGTGITPVLPMLQELLPRNEPGKVHVYWGCRDEQDLFWLDELEALRAKHPRLSLSIHLTQPALDWKGARGRITPAVLEELPRFQQPVFYMVGNGEMIKELRGQLVERGIDRKKQTRTEAFFNT